MGRTRQTRLPRCFGRPLDRRKYAYLLGVYLGDGHIVATVKGCFRLSLSCCAGWPGLVEAAACSMAAVLPRSKVHRRHVSGAVDVNSQSKHWPCLFPQHGPGKKHARRIALEAWQQEIVDEFTEELVRGLIHSDGCRSLNRVRRPLKGGDRFYTYPRYTFTNKSPDIQRIFTAALDRLDVPWRQMNAMNVSVARRAAVARLDEFVGPKY
ncbi:helix-turn-helix domain-containing protein [Actinomadura xylanilytica]|uniref:helix-turn-helix domain-containing protein n=1 Tax=Actinomadura xylanilytica TaxID=887459 RepID=UPI003D80BA04